MGVIRRPGAVLAVLTGVNVVNYLDRYVGAALLPLIIAALHLSDAQAGSLQSAFILVYALSSPAFGILGDRGHRLRLAAAGVALWTAATAASGLAQTFAALLFARALVGVGEASYAIVTPSLIADLFPAERRGRAMAYFYAAIPVGTAAGYMLGGWIGTAYGWRAGFVMAGAPGLVFAILLLLVTEPARGRFDVLDAGAPPVPTGSAWRALAARRSYVFNTAGQVVYTFGIGGLATWMPTYFVRARGLALDEATFLFGLVLVIAGFAGTIIGGQVGDALARRAAGAHFSFSGWTLLASLPFSLLATLSPHPGIFWPSMFVTLLLLFLNTGPLNAAMANVLPADLRARGFALYTLAIHVLGDALSPMLIGAASDRVGLQIPVLATGVILALSGLVLLAGRRALARDLGATR